MSDMEIECFPRLSEEQQRNLPNGYTPPPVEGMYSVTDEHPKGIIYLYVGYCDWEKNFEFCLNEFILTIFHEAMHLIFPELEDYIPYAEKIFASIFNNTRSKVGRQDLCKQEKRINPPLHGCVFRRFHGK